MKILKLLIIIFFIAGVTSCGNHYDVYQSANISNPWMATDTLNFNLSCSQLENRNLELVVEHDSDFRYENLYVGLLSPDQPIKTISIPLSNQKGQWIGNKSGSRYSVTHTIQDVPLKNQMSFEIIHYAREQLLNGIHLIGMGVVKSEH